RFLNNAFLDGATALELELALVEFYETAVRPALHTETLRRRAARVRHALAHLLRGSGSLLARLESCLSADGPYHVVGLGAEFWSALAQALEPAEFPGWTRAILQGLDRLHLGAGILGTTDLVGYRALLQLYARLLRQQPDISALHLDHFFSLTAG